jgi:mono/diheme cytochrome c family protein
MTNQSFLSLGWPLLAATATMLIGSAPADMGQPAPLLASAGVYTIAQAERGRALYQAHCASCHGGALAGADTNPPLTGGRFMANWNGQSVGALAKRIRGTMPLDDPGTLGLVETADLVAYILQANDIRSGTAELPPSPRELESIKIDAGDSSG